jgi:hypothetical protein
MDDQHRATLQLMASLVERLGPKDAGYQLILIARDYVEAGELDEARKHLAMLPATYVDDYMPNDIFNNEEFGHAVALLIDVFGLNFWMVPQGPSC